MGPEMRADFEAVRGELRADHACMNIYKGSLACNTFQCSYFTYWALVFWVAWYWSGV